MGGENLPGRVDWTSAWLCGLVAGAQCTGLGMVGKGPANPARRGARPSTPTPAPAPIRGRGRVGRGLQEGSRREGIASQAGMCGQMWRAIQAATSSSNSRYVSLYGGHRALSLAIPYAQVDDGVTNVHSTFIQKDHPISRQKPDPRALIEDGGIHGGILPARTAHSPLGLRPPQNLETLSLSRHHATWTTSPGDAVRPGPPRPSPPLLVTPPPLRGWKLAHAAHASVASFELSSGAWGAQTSEKASWQQGCGDVPQHHGWWNGRPLPAVTWMSGWLWECGRPMDEKC
jgi:hypothetical protein